MIGDEATASYTALIHPIRKAIIMPTSGAQGQMPASAAVSPLQFPLVDRDGLTKPVLQIIAEDAMESGIDSIAVLISPGSAKRCKEFFDPSRELPSPSNDRSILQREKLIAVAKCIEFIETSKDDGAILLDAKRFVADEHFTFLPADVLYISKTKDRCLEQLLYAAARQSSSCAIAVETVMKREAFERTLIAGSSLCTDPAVYEVSTLVERPNIDQCDAMVPAFINPGTRPDQFLAVTGMAIFPPPLSEMPNESLRSLSGQRLIKSGMRAIPISAAAFDLKIPFGLLEAQLALGLAGVHRTEICEMIARTLAEQAKW